MKKKGRQVLLLGAGAVIDWGGPSTSELTKLIRESGFKIKNSETTITEFIYQRLIASGYLEHEVNFETIINVIEELIVFYSEFNSKRRTPSLLKVFLKDENINEIFNFSIKGKGRIHGYTLEIPEGVDYPYSKNSYWDENPKQFFLQHLLILLLTNISARVSEYSYNSDERSVIDYDSMYSLTFRKWLKKSSERNIIRIYTLNYDNLFKTLMERDSLECFDGSVPFIQKDDYQAKPFDIKKIMTDDCCNVHYNLHGSSYWNVFPTDLNNHEITSERYIHLQYNKAPTSFQVEKGKTILVPNIITGYQKAQKSALTPFKQMQAAFDKDCMFANKLIIIGYSIGDEHINESIKTSLRHNPDLTIDLIAPNILDYDMYLAMRIFPYSNKGWEPQNIIKGKVYGFSNNIYAYKMSFIEYIEFNLNKERINEY